MMTDSDRVLIVEDVKETADWLAARVLAAFGDGRVVRQAHTLAAARKLLQREPFGMVILDLGLPDGNGVELIPELTAGRDTQVVVATIYDDDTHIFSALRAGAGRIGQPQVLRPHRPSFPCGRNPSPSRPRARPPRS